MIFKKKNLEEHRYYLLPGQGRGNKIKRQKQLFWACVVGLFLAAGIGAGIWYFSTPHL